MFVVVCMLSCRNLLTRQTHIYSSTASSQPLTDCRTAKPAASSGAAPRGGRVPAGGSSGGAAAAAEPPSMDDLLPRADISSQISGELLTKLGSANWKERKEALDDVDAMLMAAGGRIQPCVRTHMRTPAAAALAAALPAASGHSSPQINVSL